MATTKVTYYMPDGMGFIPYSARPFIQGPSYYVAQPYTPRSYDYEPPPDYIKDYADPTELNSALDVIFNEAALNKMSSADGQTPLPFGLDKPYNAILDWVQKNDREGFDLADIAQRLIAPVHLWRTSNYDPIVGEWLNPENKGFQKLGGFKHAGMNLLQNFGETMDVLANPVKGMILEEEGWLKGLERGLGLGPDGRYNYDFDFDLGSEWINKPLELAAEVLIDPFNWVSFGAWAAGKAAVNVGADAIGKAVIKSVREVGEEVSQEGIEYLTKQVVRQVRRNPEDLKKVMGDVLNAASKESFGRSAIQLASNEDFINIFQKNLIDAVTSNVNINVLTGLRRLANTSDQIEKTLLKSVGWSSGLIPGWRLIRGVMDPIAQTTYRAGIKALKGITGPKHFEVSLMQYEPLVNAFKNTMEGLPVDAVDDAGLNMLYSIRAQLIEEDLDSLYKIIQKGGSIKNNINKYFLNKPNVRVDFDTYVEHLRQLAEKFPELEYHYQNMNSVKLLRDYHIKNANAASKLKDLHEVRKTLRNSLDVLMMQDDYTDVAIKEVPGLIRRTLSILRRMPDMQSPELIKLAQDLDRAYRVLDSAGMEAAIKELTGLADYMRGLRLLEDNIENLRMFIDDQAAAIRGDIIDSSYMRHLQDAFEANKGAPFDTVVSWGDLDVLSEVRTNIDQDFLNKQATEISHHMRKAIDFGERTLKYDSRFDHFNDQLADIVNAFAVDPVGEAVEVDRFITRWYDRITTNYDTADVYRHLRRPDVAQQAGVDELSDLLKILESVQENLAPLLEQIDTLRSTQMLNNVIEYAFKESQALAMFTLLQSPAAQHLHDLALDIVQQKDFGQELANLVDIPEVGPIARSVQGRAKSHIAWVNLLSMIDADPFLEPIRANVFDTLQSYSFKDLAKLQANRNSFINEFIDKVQVQFNSIDAKRNSLDWIFKDDDAVKAEFEAYLKAHNVDSYAHNAAYDALKVKFLFQHPKYCADILKQIDLDSYMPVFYDLETTGLKAGSDRLLQIGWHTLDGRSGNIIVELPENLYPSHDVLAKVSGKTDGREARAVFDETWHSGKGIQQEEAIREFINQLQQLEVSLNPPGTTQLKRPLLVGWNNSRFDDGFLKDILHYSMSSADTRYINYFDNLQSMDGLVELNKLQGVTQLTTEQINSIRTYLSAYMNNRLAIEAGYPAGHRFIETIDGGFARDLKDLDTYQRQITDPATKNYRTRQGMYGEDYSDALQAFGQRYADTTTNLSRIANEIWEALHDLKDTNKMLMGKRIFRDTETLEFMDFKGNPIQLPGVLNTTQFMAKHTGELMRGAVKIMYRSDYFGRVFEFMDEAALTSYTARQQHYLFSRSVVRLSDALRNTTLATKHYDDFARAGELLKAKLIEWYGKIDVAMPTYVPSIATDITGTFDRYALVKQLYDKAKYIANTRGFGEELKALLTSDPALEDAFKILVNPSPMFSKYATAPAEDIFTNSFWNLKEQDLWANGKEYIKQMYDDTTHSLQERLDLMSLLRDRNHMGNASAQAGYAVLRKFKVEWDRTIKYLYENVTTEKELLEKAAELEHRLLEFNNNLALSQLDWLSKLDTEQLAKYVWMANGRVTFGAMEHISEEYSTFMTALFDTFKNRADELKKVGVDMSFDAGENRMYLWMRNDPETVQRWYRLETNHRVAEYKRITEANKKAVSFKDREHMQDWYMDLYQDLKPLFKVDEDLPDAIRQSYETSRDLTADLAHGKNLGTLGDMASREVMQAIDNHAPAAIRNQFIPLDVFAEAGHFDSFQFNRSNLGLPLARRTISPYVSGNIVKGYMNTAQSLVDVMDNRTKLMYMFFDPHHSLASGFFKDLEPDELFTMLKAHPELKLVGLVEDPKYGAMVREFKAFDATDIKNYMDLKELHITIMPVHTFIQAHQAINDFKIGGSMMQALNHWVIGPMKTGYLTSLGFVFRNIVDSAFKNIILAESPEDAVNMTKHMLETAKYYRRYKEIFARMQSYSDDVVHNVHGMYSKRVLHRMYETQGEELNKLMSEDMFQLIHDFIEQGPSAGLSKIQRMSIEKKGQKNRAKYGLPEPAKDLADKIMNNHISQGILSVNSDLEQIFRLSGYTWALENGATTDEAMYAVLKHHFDYSTRSKAEMYAEYVVPFSSFTLHNTKFWLDSLDKYGWLAGMYRDFYTPYWDFDQRDHDELANNRSIQYHILAGNIIFDDTNLVVKLNPSVMDTIRIVSDPDEALSRVNALLRVPVELLVNGTEDMSAEDWIKLVATNIPLVGPFLYRQWPDDGTVAKSLERIRNDTRLHRVALRLLPSILGAVAKYDDWEGYKQNIYTKPVRKPYARKFYPGSTYIKKPRYARKTYPRKTWARRKYAKRSYPTRRSYFRGTYATKTFFTGTYVPQIQQRSEWVQGKVLSTARGRQMRMPGRASMMRNPSPGLYRKMYTGTGRDRFLTRMVPITPRNLAARLRADWSYLR